MFYKIYIMGFKGLWKYLLGGLQISSHSIVRLYRQRLLDSRDYFDGEARDDIDKTSYGT